MRLIAAIVMVGCANPALAEAFQFEPVAELPLALGDVPPSSEPTPTTTTKWGDAKSWAFNLSVGFADDFDNTSIVPAALGVSWFPIKMFSIDLQAEGAFISQPVENAAGFGLALIVRWHFLDYETWSLYADLGIGFLATTNDVPAGASSFVFTPRASVGASFALTDQTRLLVGVGWYHISNAQTADANPGMNALQLYAGISFGF